MLPRKEEVAERIPAKQAIETGIFNHPVVVLSQHVTSFDSTPIDKRHRDAARRQPYLPIRPACHPDNGCSLVIAHGKTMRKLSYVNTKKVHEVPFEILRLCWQDADFHLESESYRILTAVLWKQNVAELTIRLKGHGIFERVPQPTHIEIPRSTMNRRADERRHHDLRYSGGHIGASSRVDSYGTFMNGPTEAALPGVYHLPVTRGSNNIASQQNSSRRNYIPTRQQAMAESNGGNQSMVLCFAVLALLFFPIPTLIVLAIWYYVYK
ncbi:unnamed protein product [Clonostachys rosea]|uniref:Uncharacterized protein n=1 Tax=Bionectria ochroleuca TaxID=29856 RepID=A0ABY6V1T7_BIOOC|nr:unnamed protein product [Clonostachys rosea]